LIARHRAAYERLRGPDKGTFMRLTKALAGLVAASLAASAAGQDTSPPAPPPAEPAAQPPAEPPAETPPQRGLSGLEDTVNQLRDEQAAEQPATPPAPAPAPAPAPTPTAPAPTPAAPAQPLGAAQRAQLDAAVQRGRLLYAISRAGLIATQDMLARVSDPAGAGIAGWIAEPEGNASRVTFFASGAAGTPPSAVYRVTILGGRVTSREVFLAGNRPPLGPHQARMAAARAAIEPLEHPACGGADLNVLVVPGAAADAPIDVYQMSVPGRRGYYPVGGHYKTMIAPDGSVAASRGFTNACLELPVPETPAGRQPLPLGVTHLLDPLPTEIHVFLALATGHPLVVVAGDPQRLFAVTGEGIAEIRN
jgi:hypothetical protein